MKLMVYGTLKQGYGNNILLRDATLLGTAITLRPFVLFNCGFPKAVPFTQDEVNFPLLPVMGEVYEVNERTLSRCDSLEGHPDWYRRVDVRVSMGDNEEHTVMIYEMPEWQRAPLCRTVTTYDPHRYYIWER